MIRVYWGDPVQQADWHVGAKETKPAHVHVPTIWRITVTPEDLNIVRGKFDGVVPTPMLTQQTDYWGDMAKFIWSNL